MDCPGNSKPDKKKPCKHCVHHVDEIEMSAHDCCRRRANKSTPCGVGVAAEAGPDLGFRLDALHQLKVVSIPPSTEAGIVCVSLFCP